MNMNAGLDYPHPDDHPLDKLIAGHVRRHAGLAPDGAEAATSDLFADSFFGLERSRAFIAANDGTRVSVRSRCAANVLEEAYFIEKSGLAYCARMLLMAEDAPTRQSFALMAADEASHLAWVTPYVPEAVRREAGHPFLKLIAQLIETAPAPVLVYVLQAILEGWGLAHYRALADGTRSARLAAVWHAILKDEAMHVRLGGMLLDPRKFSDAERAMTLEALAAFVTMVRCGPLGVVGTLAAHGADAAAAHEDLGGGDDAARKLALLRTLMDAEGMGWAGETLAGKGLFKPMSAREAVSFGGLA